MWKPQLVICPCGTVFEQHRHRQKYCRPEHRPNLPQPHRHQLKTTARGYGREHQLRRAAALAALKPGALCPRCGDEMYPDQNLHLGHADDDRNVYLGLSHARCNLAAANRHRKRPWWQREQKQLALFAPPKPPKPLEPPKPKAMRWCACGAEFEAAKSGRADRCPDCRHDLAKHALAMRNAGVEWKEIAAAIGYSSPGAAHNLVMSWRYVA